MKNEIKTNIPIIYNIYGLIDPNTHMIRYVGCTINLKARYKSHFTDQSNKRKLEWINTLVANNQKPNLVILMQTKNILVAREKEIYWQNKFGKENLLNGPAGLYSCKAFVRKYNGEKGRGPFAYVDYDKVDPEYCRQKENQ